jgi:hypothetical protein
VPQRNSRRMKLVEGVTFELELGMGVSKRGVLGRQPGRSHGGMRTETWRGGEGEKRGRGGRRDVERG